MQYHNGSLTLNNNERGGVDAIMQLPLQADKHKTITE
jgi:hypothetical protein